MGSGGCRRNLKKNLIQINLKASLKGNLELRYKGNFGEICLQITRAAFAITPMFIWVPLVPPKLSDFLLKLSSRGPPSQMSLTHDMAMLHLSLIFFYLLKTYPFWVPPHKRSGLGELTDLVVMD